MFRTCTFSHSTKCTEPHETFICYVCASFSSFSVGTPTKTALEKAAFVVIVRTQAARNIYANLHATAFMLGTFHGRPLTFDNSSISSVSSLIGSPSDRHLRVTSKRKRQLSVQASKAKGNYSKTTKKAATPEKVRGTLCCSGTLPPSGYQIACFAVCSSSSTPATCS